MGIIMRNNVAYSGSGGSETVELSMAEYEAREAAGAIDSDTWYLIYDATDSYNAKKVVYDNAESGMTARTVQGAIDELNSNLGVRYNHETDMIEIFYNGIWNEWKVAGLQEWLIYNYGSVIESLTLKHNAIYQSNNIELCVKTSGSTIGVLYSTDKIDVTKYNKLNVECYANVVPDGYSSNFSFGFTDNVVDSNPTYVGNYHLVATSSTVDDVISIDISEIKGSYYLAMQGYRANVNVRKIWLS